MLPVNFITITLLSGTLMALEPEATIPIIHITPMMVISMPKKNMPTIVANTILKNCFIDFTLYVYKVQR